MPIYVYEEVLESGEGGEQFEFLQRMADRPLTRHPHTGRPIRRIITGVNIGGAWSESAMEGAVKDDKKLERLGFTKYVKSAEGTYEKTVGKGPKTIQK